MAQKTCSNADVLSKRGSHISGGHNDKYAGLEDLDVGSKFRMFERKSASPERPEHRGPASDRFGIMEKLKRLQVCAGLGLNSD